MTASLMSVSSSFMRMISSMPWLSAPAAVSNPSNTLLSASARTLFCGQPTTTPAFWATMFGMLMPRLLKRCLAS